jgi:hypothetical protein
VPLYQSFLACRPFDEYTPGFNLVDVDQKEVSWSDGDYAAFAA